MSNGQVNYNKAAENGGYPVNTHATYSCNYGYRSIGGPRTCKSTGSWNLWFFIPPGCYRSNKISMLHNFQQQTVTLF